MNTHPKQILKVENDIFHRLNQLMNKHLENKDNCNKFASIEPEMHTIRTALGSFFYIAMSSKPARTMANQTPIHKLGFLNNWEQQDLWI